MTIKQTVTEHLCNVLKELQEDGDDLGLRIADLQAIMHVFVNEQVRSEALDFSTMSSRYEESYQKYRAEYATAVNTEVK